MSTLDRYILRQVLWPSVVGLALLLLLFTVFTSVRLMRSAGLGNLPAADIMTLILAHDLSALEILLPTAFFGGLMLVMCNWHRNGEAYAAYCGGVYPQRLSRVLVGLTLTVSVCVAVLSIVVRPHAYQLRYELKERGSNLESSHMQSQHFYNWDEGFVIKAQEVSDERPNMRAIFAHRRSERSHVVLHSRAGQIDQTDASRRQRIEFIDGATYEIATGTEPDRITQFSRLVYWAKRPGSNATTKRRARGTAALAGSASRKETAEFQWRFSMPFIALFMLLMTVEMSRLKPQQSPYPRYGFALVMYVLVFTTMNVVTSAVENGALPRMPGVFTAVLLVGGVYLKMRRFRAFSLSAPG